MPRCRLTLPCRISECMAKSPRPGWLGDVCRVLQASERDVYELEDRGELRSTRTPGGLRIFDLDQAEKLAAKRAREREASSASEATA
jgi:hypothetical protein